MRVFKSSITSTFGRRERGRVVEVVRARGFQSRHSSLLYNSTRRREGERERIKGVVVAVTVLTLPFTSSFVGQSEEKKEAKFISKKSNLAVKKEKVCSPRTRLSLLHSFARARYTHTRFYRAVVILSPAYTRGTNERRRKRQKERVVEAFFFFGGFVRVRESRRARCLLFFPTGSSFTCCGGNLVKR